MYKGFDFTDAMNLEKNEISITIKYGQKDNIIPKLDSDLSVVDIHTINMLNTPESDPVGKIHTVKDELLNFGTSYFLKYKTGFLKFASIPILFADEDLEYHGKVLVMSPKGEKRGNQHLFSSKRRLLIVQSSYILSFWFDIDMNQYLGYIGKTFETMHLNLVESIKKMRMEFLLGKWLFGKQIVIGWIIRDGDNSPKNVNRFIIRGNIAGRGSYRNVSEKVCDIIFEKANKGFPTDFLELLAMESYCLTSNNLYHHPIKASFRTMALKSGRLNLGQKKKSLK